jgi:nucleotide-binding universal stress UspA family protein
MKRILIPTDFSKHAGHSIDYVLNLFEQTQSPCRILLLNTYIFQQTDPKQVLIINDELKKRSKEGLAFQKEELLKRIKNPNITVETISHLGSLHNVVLQLLQKEEVDLVAMGKDTGKHLAQISELLKQHHCPVLITHL